MFKIMAKSVLKHIGIDELITLLEGEGFDQDEIEEFLEEVQE